MKKFAFLVSHPHALHPVKDTSLGLMNAAERCGCQCFVFTPETLRFKDGIVADVAPIETAYPTHSAVPQIGRFEPRALADLDAVFMRHDPPFGEEYLHSTYLLEMAEKEGALVINRPASVRSCNEKLFALEFPQCCPPSCVSSRISVIKGFLKEQSDIVVKPLNAMGGESVFRLRVDDPNVNVILEVITRKQQRSVLAQKFIAEVSDGDKRVLLIHGEPVDYALARIPQAGENRANIAAGGRGRAQLLSDRDRWICDQLADALIHKELFFVGVDIIGDYLTEINVTSPTCMREIDQQTDIDIGRLFFSSLFLHYLA